MYNSNKVTLLDKVTKALKQYISKIAEHVTRRIWKKNGNLDQRGTIGNLDNNITKPKHHDEQQKNHNEKGHHFLKEDLEPEEDLE